MADDATVKQLLLQVDATTELLRRNLDKADSALATFQTNAQRRLDQTDEGFKNLGKGLDNIRPAIDRANAQLGAMGVTAQRVQKQVEASMGLIRQSLLASAGTLAGAFAADKVKEYADGYTRFTNQLKVAGLEGRNLGTVQEALFQIAQKNGAPLEAIGTLYGRSAQTAKALGASQSDLLRFTGAVGAALKVQGGHAEEAAGALLQLSQALGSGTVHAEEFNSVNEGLRPLLQAAAEASDKYRGNVAALKADVVAQKLASQDLFRLVLAGYDSLQEKASKAGLTIGGSFVALGNALTKYIGGVDQSLGVTERFTQGMSLLANNLDTVGDALATIAITYGTAKVGTALFSGIDAALGAQKGLTAEVLKGNAAYIDTMAIRARLAVEAQEAATAEVAGIEAALVARREEQVSLAATIAAERELAETSRARAALAAASNVAGADRTPAIAAQSRAESDAAFATDRLAAARARLAVVDGEVAVAEAERTAALGRQVVATEAATVATEAATLGARASAAATALFSGALQVMTATLPIIAIGAFVGVLLELHEATTASAQQVKEFAQRHADAAKVLRDTASAGLAANTVIAASGASASQAAPAMLRFANATGEAALRLQQLAQARRKDLLDQLQDAGNKAQTTIDQAQGRINSRRNTSDALTAAGGVGASVDPGADDADRQALRRAQADLTALRKRYQAIAAQPLEARLSGSEMNAGRDIEGDLARVTRDLTIARESGAKAQIATLEAEKFELTQYKKYVKQGLSPQTAQAQASQDAAAFKSAAETKQGRADQAKAARDQAKEQRSALAAQRKTAQDERAYDNASRQALDEIAAARESMATSADEQASIARQKVADDLKSKNDAVDKQGPSGTKTFTQAQVDALKNLNTLAAVYKLTAIDMDAQRKREAEAAAVADAGRQAQQDMLQTESQLATTRKQRLTIELRLLDLQQQEEQARINSILAYDSKASDSEKAQALVQQQTIDARYGAKKAVALQSNADPLQAYGRQLHENTDDMNDALKGVAADGLKSIEDGFAGVVSGTKSVKQAFKDMAASILADLAKIAVEKLIVNTIGSSLFGLKDGGSVDGYKTGGIPGFASGVPAINDNRISGPGSGTSDSILAMVGGKRLIRVSNGESIITAQATREHWPLIKAMNEGRLPKFAGGGLVSPNLSVRRVSTSEMRQVAQARQGGGEMRLKADVNVTSSPLLHAEMQNVSLQTSMATAEPIMIGAQARTMKALNRAKMPGGYGG